MGLDVHLAAVEKDIYYEAEVIGKDFEHISLSRTFCNLFFFEGGISHKDKINYPRVLSQIEELININIKPIEMMSWYCDDICIKSQLGIYEEEDEKQQFIKETKVTNEKVVDNIDKVLETINNLIDKLSKIEDLHNKLFIPNPDSQRYFSKFNDDLGSGYINNNFGQDIRNLKTLIEFAKSINVKTVYFNFE